MKKRKTYEISVIDRTYSKIISDETKFYTSDTALELSFELKETEYTFESAEIVLLNIDDRSLVTRPVVKSTESFTYEIEDDIVAHYGEWRSQLRFEQAGEIYVSSPVKFRIENDLGNERPPQLSDVQSWVSLKRYADSLTEELKQAVLEVERMDDTFKANELERQATFETAESERNQTFNTNEETRQANETARIEAEKQRNETVKNIEDRQSSVENQFISVQEELTEKDVISAPEIIAARNGEADLKSRLDKEHQEVTAQLAQKVGKDATDLTINMFKESDRAVLQGQEPGHINAVLGKGNVESGNIGTGEVTPRTISFITKKSDNLWNGEFTNTTIDRYAPNAVIEDGGNSINVINEVPTNKRIVISKSTDTDNFRVAFFSEYPKEGMTPVRYQNLGASPAFNTTTAENERYVLVYLSSDTEGKKPSEFMIKNDTVGREYQTPNKDFVIPLHQDSLPEINPKKLSIMKPNANNLFDGNYDIGYVTGSPATFHDDVDVPAIIIPAEPNQQYTVKASEVLGKIQVATFESKPIRGEVVISDTTSWNVKERTFTTSDTANWLFISVSTLADRSTPTWITVEKGETADSAFKVASEYLPKSVGTGSPIPDTYITGNFRANYIPTTELPSTGLSLDLDFVYAWFDDLIARHPNYIKRSLLTTETTGLPVYQYEFTPPSTNQYSETLPKILHVLGIHPEKHGMASGLRFYKDLCDHWQENELLQIFRWNVGFVVIPAFNAWGVANNSRTNANGVNLNRNFTVDWAYIVDENDGSGSEPLSEPESQAMVQLLSNRKDIIFAIDHHNFSSFAQAGYTLWTAGKNLELNKWLSGFARNAQSDFAKLHPELNLDNKSNVSVEEAYALKSQGWLSYEFGKYGIPGTILEMSGDDSLNDFHTQQVAKLISYAVENFADDKTKLL